MDCSKTLMIVRILELMRMSNIVELPAAAAMFWLSRDRVVQAVAVSHWEEASCLRFELMSSELSPTQYISGITIGSLDDLQYGVDYGQAENLPLDGSCCRRRLGDPEPPRRKLLSDAATATAVAFGQQLLASQPEFNPRGSSFTFSGIVNVLMLEDGEVFDVMVTADGAI